MQPNVDVIVESDCYPAKIIRQIAALAEQVGLKVENGPVCLTGPFVSD
jgi:hypothetical protein